MKAIEIAFDSCRSGSGPLTWAQKSMWNNIQRIAPNDQHLNMRHRVSFPDGVPYPRAVDGVRVLLSRHDALRTTFPVDGPEPRQRVVGSGRIPLTLVDGDGSAEHELTQLESHLAARRFDNAVELPLRVGMIVRGDTVYQVLLCLSHMAIDAWSSGLLQDELATLLEQPSAQAGAAALLEPPTRQPLEQARFERVELAPRSEARTLAYWREVLAECPPADVLPGGHPAASPRFWHGSYDSAAAAVSARVIADAAGVSTSSTFLAAFARAICDYAGVDKLPLWLRVSNRFFPELQRTVVYLAQNAPVLIDAAPRSVTKLAKSVHQRALRAYRHGQYDPDQLRQLLASVDSSRATPVDLTSTFNAVPGDPPEYRRDQQPTTSALSDLTKRSAFSWRPGFDNERIRTFISVSGGGELSMIADSRYVPPDQLEAILRRVEALLVTEASG